MTLFLLCHQLSSFGPTVSCQVTFCMTIFPLSLVMKDYVILWHGLIRLGTLSLIMKLLRSCSGGPLGEAARTGLQ